jgi:hypothetical protein
MKRRTRLVYDDASFIEAEYLDGTCPGCKIWEAPTTVEDLRKSKELHAHVGSGPILQEKNVRYRKLVWKEYFKCPICQMKFSIKFNDF